MPEATSAPLDLAPNGLIAFRLALENQFDSILNELAHAEPRRLRAHRADQFG